MSQNAALIYGWVRGTRKGLLDYAVSLPPDVFTQERNDFGWGSVRNLLVHTADCYRFWLLETALGEKKPAFEASTHPDAGRVARLYGEVDGIVEAFLARHPVRKMKETLSLEVRWAEKPLLVTPLWLLTHTVTHEFHHKGQVVALGRVLGYPPPETDLILP